MKNTTIKVFVSAVLTIAALTFGQLAMAVDWSVTISGSTFTITRSSGTGIATVFYRTVSISALEGKNFTGVNGSLTFAEGETSKQVAVTESAFADLSLRYKYQGTRFLYYDFVVTDQQGSQLAKLRQRISSGGDMNNQYYLNGYTNWVVKEGISRFAFFDGTTVACFMNSKYHDAGFTPPSSYVESKGDYAGYALIDDSWDYSQKPATVSPDYLFATNRAGATGAWHKLIGNKLYASVYFTEKEKDDGYAYVQILIGDSNTAYDEGYDPNETVNTPVNSIYKACFELKKGSGAYSGAGKWIFPHSSDVKQQGVGYQTFWMDESYLWEQKFRSESYRAGDDNNAFVLDPDISALTVRFDCGGSGDDTFGYKDLYVRWALLDAVAPSVLSSEITVSPGLHCKGNPVTISVPFSEPVRLEAQTRYILHTSWGDLYADYDCIGSNVVSFSGTITANAGTSLTINSLENVVAPGYSSSAAIIPIRDILGNNFTGSISKSLDVTTDALYSISYNLNGGSVATPNPTKYTNNSGPITLVNPTRPYYVFTGWTGTGLDSPTMTVTIPNGSSGDRSYTATWAPDFSAFWSGDGSQGNPYVITTAEGLNFLALMVNESNYFSGTYFELGADIDLSGYSPFSGIGSDSKQFRGKFDGKGYSIDNLTINADGQEKTGLFRNVYSSAEIKNVVVRDATVSGTLYVGAVVGYADVVNVSNCTALSSTISGVNTTNNYNAVGAVIGFVTNGFVDDCSAYNCTVTGSSTNTLYLGGITGRCGTQYYPRRVNGSIVSGCTINGTATSSANIGTVVGYLQSVTGNGYATSSNNFILNTSTNGTGTVYGTQSGDVKFNNNHYHALTCGEAAPVSDVFTVNGTGITVSGTATVNHAQVNYYSQDTEITVSAASDYTLSGVSFTPEGGAETPATSNGNGSWTFTMPGADVTVNVLGDKPVSTQEGIVLGETDYVSTFYDGKTDYLLPEGARAYTAGLEGGRIVFYQIGDNGRVIPHGTAAIIVSNVSGVSLTVLTSTTVTARAGNILLGTDTAIAKPAGTVYVLNISEGTLGLYKFTGSTIPAHKAYYIAE